MNYHVNNQKRNPDAAHASRAFELLSKVSRSSAAQP